MQQIHDSAKIYIDEKLKPIIMEIFSKKIRMILTYFYQKEKM